MKKPRQYTLVHNPTSAEIDKMRETHIDNFGNLDHFVWDQPDYRQMYQDRYDDLAQHSVGDIVWAMPDGGQFLSRKRFTITRITETTVYGTYNRSE